MPRYRALDALRGVCALLVCLFHFRAAGPLGWSPFVRGSWLFVDFFFVLSGFVIAANYRDRLIAGNDRRGFVIRRLGRIYPLHLVMLLAYVAVELAGLLAGVGGRPMFDAHHSVPAILAHLTLTQPFAGHGGLSWNQPSWTIAVEFWTYLLYAAAARRAGEGLERWLGVAIIASLAGLMALSLPTLNIANGFSLLRCIAGFGVGAAAWQLSGRVAAAPYRGATAVELVMVAAVITFVCLAAEHAASFAAPLLFGLVVLVFARAGGLVSRLLQTRGLQALGVLSFSIYMVHSFVQSRIDDVLPRFERLLHVQLLATRTFASGRTISVIGTTPLAGTLLALVMLALVLAVSALSRRHVEQPGQRLAKRLAARP
ncbi:MAG: acyltransferase [Alphaproteobacteria bacterium PA4]|nr:MAG: acyltransferase [Alphaproteobacteria bacterium PA4]